MNTFFKFEIRIPLLVVLFVCNAFHSAFLGNLGIALFHLAVAIYAAHFLNVSKK